MAQAWDDLLFAHWPLHPAQLRHLVRPPPVVDTFHGQAWLGVIAFRISRIHWVPGDSAAGCRQAERSRRTQADNGGSVGSIAARCHHESAMETCDGRCNGG